MIFFCFFFHEKLKFVPEKLQFVLILISFQDQLNSFKMKANCPIEPQKWIVHENYLLLLLKVAFNYLVFPAE